MRDLIDNLTWMTWKMHGGRLHTLQIHAVGLIIFVDKMEHSILVSINSKPKVSKYYYYQSHAIREIYNYNYNYKNKIEIFEYHQISAD